MLNDFILFLFFLSILIPIGYAFLNLHNVEAIAIYLSYPILSLTLVIPIIIIISFFKIEKFYRNPLKPLILFLICYINIVLISSALNYQLQFFKEINIQKLGLFELHLIIFFINSISSIILNTQTTSLFIIQYFSFEIPLELISLFLFSIFIYFLISIYFNIKKFKEEFYYLKWNLLKENIDNIFYVKNLAITVIISILISFIIISLVSTLMENISLRFIYIILSLPYILILLILFFIKGVK